MNKYSNISTATDINNHTPGVEIFNSLKQLARLCLQIHLQETLTTFQFSEHLRFGIIDLYQLLLIILYQYFQKESTFLITWIQISGLQNYYSINFCDFKGASFW